MTDPRAFSSQEVCLLAGLTYRQLDHWCRKGAITPSVDTGQGMGTARRWSISDADALGAIVQVARDLASLQSKARMPIELVERIWEAWHAAGESRDIVIEVGTIAIEIERPI